MPSSPPRLLASAAALAMTAFTLGSAHSHIAYVIVNGLLYQGFNPHTPNNDPDSVVGWSTTATDDGFVPPSNYSTPDIICHRDAKPAGAHIPVRAGDRLSIQWNGWPLSHHGPVLSYLAPCPRTDGCAAADKAALAFSKIDDSCPGLLSGADPGGTWATDVLIAANNSWLVGLPPRLAPGPYVLRHELLALHYAARPGGAQNYPQCVNLWVVADPSTTAPANASAATMTTTAEEATGALDLGLRGGVPATALYGTADPGIDIDIYASLSTYVIPGPTVVSGAAPVAPGRQTASSASVGNGTPVFVSAGKTVPAAARRTARAARAEAYPRAAPGRGPA